MTAMLSPLPLPEFIARRIDDAAIRMLTPEGQPQMCFSRPAFEPALVDANSLSWRIFKNPISLFVGGIAAVILELAEPGVRTGVWEHSSFRKDPLERLKRTGLAAMVTVYGPRSVALSMIEGVVRRHAKVSGETPHGAAYNANDADLLNWVQATASFGFAEAYSAYVHPLSRADLDRLYAEAAPAARAYGAVGAPTSQAEMEAVFAAMEPRLERSEIVFEFLEIMNRTPALPVGGAGFQRLLIRAAVEIVPTWVRDRLGLGANYGLSALQKAFVKQAGALSDKVMIRSSPAVQSCLRMGLPADYLYK
jgi:uncharacterized protein (DUF2236 family)